MTPPRIIILAFLLIHIQLIAQNKSVYIHRNKLERITLNGNRFEYFWHRIYDVGAINDTVQHTGTFTRKGDTLIMTSDKKFWFNNYKDIKVVEEKLNLDSIYIVISAISDTIPFFFVQPYMVMVNDYYYKLKRIHRDSACLVIPQKKLKYIYIPSFPIYYIKKLIPIISTFILQTKMFLTNFTLTMLSFSMKNFYKKMILYFI